MDARYTIVIPDLSGGADRSVEVSDPGAEQFASRMRKVAKQRRKWAAREGISCYRVYDADLPDFASAIDLYEGVAEFEGERYVVVAEYAAPKTVDATRAQMRFDDTLRIVAALFNVDEAHLFAKRRVREKGGSQYTQERKTSCVALTQESGYLVELDFGGYLDTGIFLDHRTTRQMVGKMAPRTRFLNLFSYTGTATLHAAGSGAATTTTVDMSQTYLDRAQRNMKRNGFTGNAHRFIRADVMQWIVDEVDRQATYDLIFIDPPTFSNSKSMGNRTWDVQRDHVWLLSKAACLLACGGTIVFSNNLRGFKLDREGLAAHNLSAEDISEQTIPYDFERNPKIHRCFILHKID